jgi:hypothetical protein
MLKELLLLWNLVNPLNAQELDKRLDVIYLGKTIGVAELKETKKNSETRTIGYVRLDKKYKRIYKLDVVLDEITVNGKTQTYTENINHRNYWAVHSFNEINQRIYINTNEEDPLMSYKVKPLEFKVITPVSAYKDIIKSIKENNLQNKSYQVLANTVIGTVPCTFNKTNSQIIVTADFSENKKLAGGLGGIEKIVLCFTNDANLDTVKAYKKILFFTTEILGVPSKE